ncbi:TPA: hypothetical protein N0F65_007081 [Lagenidium giganteum]|uniref:Protein kinase domain-containing protein n=1 Tax=Lagenidium giganteum TaxID=4803 RepID=A0AAV2YS43_9STRA|nr:TPA: hypothetical protein N0F65_007081 [Lagenidium giganteum]
MPSSSSSPTSSTSPSLSSSSPTRKNPYQVIRELGSGLQGRVVLAFDEHERRYVAIKLPSVFETAASNGHNAVDLRLLDYQVQSIVQERRALRFVGSHPNVLQYVRMVPGSKMNQSYVALVTEYASNGDLFDLIADTGAFDEDLAKFYFAQLLSDQFTMKLCDFGLATVVAPSRGEHVDQIVLRDVSGTGLYMAPEISRTTPYRATPTDLWSAGVVLFIMLTGFPPFQEAARDDHWYECVVQGEMDKLWEAQCDVAEMLSADARDMIAGLLCSNADKRLTIADCFAHPWMQDVDMVDRKWVVEEMTARRLVALNASATI